MNLNHAMSLPDAEALYTTLFQKILPDSRKYAALVGIHTGGAWLAKRLHRDLVATHTGNSPEFVQQSGMLSVSFHRDDFDKIGLHAQKKSSEIPFPVDGAHILLIDDVLQSGRTIRAAINELFDYGRPASISLAVLVDRGNRELPICAQYIGATLSLPNEKTLELNHDDHGKFYLSMENKNGADTNHRSAFT